MSVTRHPCRQFDLLPKLAVRTHFALDRFFERARRESPSTAALPVARVLRIAEMRSLSGARSQSSRVAIALQRATPGVAKRGVTIAHDAAASLRFGSLVG